MFTESDKKSLITLRTQVLQLYSKKISELNDPKLTSLFFDNCIITGGCISSVFWGTPVKDIDIYAKDHKQIKIISDFLIEVGIYIADTSHYNLDDTAAVPTASLVTNNAITLKNKIQFITLGTAEESRKKFDFIHCMPWIDIKSQKLYISEAQFNSIKSREIVLNKRGETPQAHRVQKYVDKGWKTTWEASQITSTASVINTPTSSAIVWKESGMEFPGLVAQEMTALYPQTVDLK
jgi:hypothetical protein